MTTITFREIWQNFSPGTSIDSCIHAIIRRNHHIICVEAPFRCNCFDIVCCSGYRRSFSRAPHHNFFSAITPLSVAILPAFLEGIGFGAKPQKFSNWPACLVELIAETSFSNMSHRKRPSVQRACSSRDQSADTFFDHPNFVFSSAICFESTARCHSLNYSSVKTPLMDRSSQKFTCTVTVHPVHLATQRAQTSIDLGDRRQHVVHISICNGLCKSEVAHSDVLGLIDEAHPSVVHSIG